MTDSSIPVRLAGTAILLRDSAEGLETLLLRRNAKLAFAGGAWVFPGGAIDALELEVASTEEQAARTATVREVHEECGLTIAEDSLVHFCNWTTPIGEKRRFATWFLYRTAATMTVSSEPQCNDSNPPNPRPRLHPRKYPAKQQLTTLHVYTDGCPPPPHPTPTPCNPPPSSVQHIQGVRKRAGEGWRGT